MHPRKHNMTPASYHKLITVLTMFVIVSGTVKTLPNRNTVNSTNNCINIVMMLNFLICLLQTINPKILYTPTENIPAKFITNCNLQFCKIL